ncbi:TPA: hypothetical protein DCQ44_02145 [Candidatus Taylorbacteria bacterium]|nr:hypothetical protein [Candidatus Taylorbacteria bacterium]
MTKPTNLEQTKKNFLITKVSKKLLAFHAVLSLVYFAVLAFVMPMSNPVLFVLLIAGEVFHIFQMLMYLYTIWETDYQAMKDESFTPNVDVFVTVAGEPIDIVEETIMAIKKMDYPAFEVHILNDGYVAHKENWQEVVQLAEKYDINCITRNKAGGAKAGNINHAIGLTSNPYIAIFDADHVPHADFLRKTVSYFADKKVGFVQSPQFYKNYNENFVTRSAWEQQELFFGPICKGKNRLNSVTMCGTNMVISRDALVEVGGMCQESIAEDFLTGMFMHSNGWKSVYVPEVLAEGLAPEDFLSYFKQQMRWARGGLDAVLQYNLFFRKGLSLAQRLQYISSSSFYFSGLVVLLNAFLPIIFLFTGMVPIAASTMLLASIFLPYIFFTVYILQRSTNFSFTFPAIAFSMGAFNVHLRAMWASITKTKSKFEITPKRQVSGVFTNLVVPQILYICIVLAGITFAFTRDGLSASFIANSAWAIFNGAVFTPFIYAATFGKWQKSQKSVSKEVPVVGNEVRVPAGILSYGK